MLMMSLKPIRSFFTRVKLVCTSVARKTNCLLFSLGQVYNISSDHEMSTRQLAELMVKLWNRDPKETIEFVADRAINDERYVLLSPSRVNGC